MTRCPIGLLVTLAFLTVPLAAVAPPETKVSRVGILSSYSADAPISYPRVRSDGDRTRFRKLTSQHRLGR
jgi:hypothetical protein